MNNAIVQLKDANQLLAKVKTMQDAQKIIGLAEAARVYAQQAHLGLEAQNYGAEIKLRAERRAGEILSQSEMNKGGRPPKTGNGGDTGFIPTLQEIGISKEQSHRWQMVAVHIPEPYFEQYIAETKAKGVELTSIRLLRIAVERQREQQRRDNAFLVNQAPPLPNIKAKTIMIDPPWDWGDEADVDQFGRARPTYSTMPFQKLLELPVTQLADDDSHIYLWITNRSLPKGFELLERWGFRYITLLTWCKPSFGMGNYFRGQTEHILFGVKGSCLLLRHDVGTWFMANRSNNHSSKPERIYEIIEACSPGPWLELFARAKRDGWYTWGAEIGAEA